MSKTRPTMGSAVDKRAGLALGNARPAFPAVEPMADREATYRLRGYRRVSLAALLAPHVQQTVRPVRAHGASPTVVLDKTTCVFRGECDRSGRDAAGTAPSGAHRRSDAARRHGAGRVVPRHNIAPDRHGGRRGRRDRPLCPRWTNEEYFKALKSGCVYERRQLESRDTLLNALGLLAPFAWPTPTAAAALPRGCVGVLQALARLGGHVPHNGRPGWPVIWTGYRNGSTASRAIVSLVPN